MSEFLGLHHTAFPDLRVSVEDLVAEGDKVVALVSATDAHQGTQG